MDTKELIEKLRSISNMRSTSSFKRMICKMAAQRLERLTAYEDAGLEPESILQLKKISEIFNCSTSDPEQLKHILNKIQSWADAEREGRLVQYVPGDTVFDRFGKEWTVRTTEILRFDGSLKYLYRCWHPGTDDYYAMYSDEILTREEAEAALKGENHETDSV